MIFKTIYKKIFPGWEYYLIKETTGYCNALDLACGDNSPIQYTAIPRKVGVDMFSEYIRESRRKNIHHEYVCENILTAHFPEKSFDLVLCSEIIEHLDKKDGFVLLNNAERWARKKVVITTPNGYLPQSSYDDNSLQEHKSGWSVDDFRARGYIVHGIGGLKLFKGERAHIKYRPYFLWKILSDISQKIIYFFPRAAFQLLAIKKYK